MIKEYVVFFKGALGEFAPAYFDDLKDAKLYAEMSEMQEKLVNPELVQIMRVVPLAD